MASPYPKSKTTILLGMVLVIGLVASCGGETGAAPQPGAHFTATPAISPEAGGPGRGGVPGGCEAPGQAAGEATIRYDADEGGGLSNFVIHDRTALCDLG